MRHIYLLLFLNILYSTITLSQDNEKLIVNQSLLIEALREYQIGNKEKASEILEGLKHEADCKGVSNFLLSKIFKSDGKLEEAIEAINAAIFTEPDNIWYLKFKITLTELNSKDLETGLTYEKLSSLEEKQFSHYDNAAYYYLKADEFNKALEILNKAEKVFGLLPQIITKKSFTFCFLKKDKNALEILQLGHAKYPTDLEILTELINKLISFKKNNEAEKYILLLEKLDPENSELDKYYTSINKPRPGNNYNSLSQKIESQNISLDDKIKILFLKLNDYIDQANHSGVDSLINPALSLKSQFPESPKPSALLADIYFQLNDLSKAKTEYIQSILQGSVPYSVWDNLLYCLIKLNQWKTAKFFSSQCIDLYPNQSFPNYVHILSQYKLNELNGLLPQLEYLELIVNHNIQKKTEVLILKAKILHFLNKGQESEQIWKKALENDHDYLATLEYCTFMASTGKSYPEELFDKAMRSQFIQQSYKADKAAEIHYFKKDYTNAKSFIETSLKQGNFQSIETLKLAVKIYAALGDSDSVNRHNDRIKLLTEQDTIDTYQLLLNSK